MSNEPLRNFLLAKLAAGSEQGAKLASRLAEVETGTPVSVATEDVPQELLALFTSDAQRPLTARAIDPSKIEK